MPIRTLDLDRLRRAVVEDAAIRGEARLQPAAGPGQKAFPPTHAVEEKRLRADERPGARYARERRRIGDEVHDVVLLDSVQSQANRMEAALQSLWQEKAIVLPVLDVALGQRFPDLGGITSLTAPHRISDALLRDSLLDGTLFRYSRIGRSLSEATHRDASLLFHACPSALVFGLWDSTGPKGGLGIKVARNIVAEIVAIDVVFGTKTASRIDPTGILRDPSPIFRADPAHAPEEQWTLDPATAERDRSGQPLLYGKTDRAGTATAINHSNVPPTLDVLGGGITFRYATQTLVVSLAGIRRLSFGDRDPRPARTVLAALGLLAAVAAAERGYDLRSRCLLVPEPGKSLAFAVVAKDGTLQEVALDLAGAMALYGSAVEALPDGLVWRGAGGAKLGPGELLASLEPTPKLLRLIEESRKRAVVEDNEAAD